MSPTTTRDILLKLGAVPLGSQAVDEPHAPVIVWENGVRMMWLMPICRAVIVEFEEGRLLDCRFPRMRKPKRHAI